MVYFKHIISKSQWLFLGLILIYSSSFLFLRFSEGYTRHSDLNSLIYAYFARNLLRYPAATHQYVNINAVTPKHINSTLNYFFQDQFTYYLDHSPLLTYLVAISFLIFGINEPASRLVPITSSLATLIVFYLLVRNHASSKVALLATFFLGSFPLFLQHGQIVNFEPTTLMFIVISLYFFDQHYYFGSKKISFWVGYLFFLMAQFSDWPGSFVGVAVATIALIKKKPANYLILPLLFSLLGPLLIFSFYQHVAPKFGPGFTKSVFLPYFETIASYPHGIIGFIDNQKYFLNTNITHSAAILSLVSIIPLLRRFHFVLNSYKTINNQFIRWVFSARSFFETNYLVFIGIWFFIIGGLNIALFPAWSGTHLFWGYYLLPGCAILSALGMKEFFTHTAWFKVFGLLLFILFVIQAKKMTIDSIYAQAINPKAITKYHHLQTLIPPDQVIFSNQPIYDYGPARRLRYYVDRPVYVAKSLPEAQVSGRRGRFWILSTNDNEFANQIPGKRLLIDPDLIIIDTQQVS